MSHGDLQSCIGSFFRKELMIYVLSKDGQPLMPIRSERRAKRFLKNGKARVVNAKPFTIQLTYDIETSVVDKCVIGIDPGRTNIGVCVTDSKGEVLFTADVETRNKDIPRLMDERRRHRQQSRHGERKVRQREAIRCDKTGTLKNTEVWRMLPGYSKPVRCKVFRNTEARFNNRKRSEGWLTPTARHLLLTHINLVKKISTFLPVSEAVVEVNRFAFMKMDNPDIKNYEYQQGRLKGFESVDDYVSRQQNDHCLFCNRKIDHFHHIVPRSEGGSDTPENIAGLCERHHNLVHTDQAWTDKLLSKKTGINKKYGALSVLNQIMPFLVKELVSLMPTDVTFGYDTAKTRESYHLPKSENHDGHYIDAWTIAVSTLDIEPDVPKFGEPYKIKQFRRHDRQIVRKQSERTYYLDGKPVCKNRHKRTGQKADSLAEWRFRHPSDVGRLVVKKSTRSYNDVKRLMPGTIFIYNGKAYILRGSDNHGTRYYAENLDNSHRFSSSKCRIAKRNSGLVFL